MEKKERAVILLLSGILLDSKKYFTKDDVIDGISDYKGGILKLFGYSGKSLADCGDLSIKCDFRRKDKCHSIKECSLKIEIT